VLECKQHAPVAQGIERRPPEPCAGVRVAPGVYILYGIYYFHANNWPIRPVICFRRARGVGQPRQGRPHGMSRLCTWFFGIELWPLAKPSFDLLAKCIYTPSHEDRNELAMAHFSCSVWAP
jgi:hypothetical protein